MAIAIKFFGWFVLVLLCVIAVSWTLYWVYKATLRASVVHDEVANEPTTKDKDTKTNA
jgi:hypothetical protein